MSTGLLQNPVYGPGALEQNWLNTIYGTHDLMCGCPKPIEHLLQILKKKCLLTEDGTDGEEKGDTPEEGFGPGDLDKLFEEDVFGEDEGEG